ncbi:odorant receptor 131-2-like [Alosa sapidissima]|uniref:odorant receptor 131-2-like n=1 Tax=Alosa sapidissima TaxID=34773 RepID=UPI001C09A0BC|nr:odorant receptor 131-2-like [Alosa sapidissima]
MALTNNSTKEVLQQASIARSVSKFAVMVLMSFVFIYINNVMFITLWSKPVLRETSRYILFAHMLCNDSIQLLFSSIIGFISFCCRPAKAVCSILILVTDSTSRITPLNLAVMSLERYVAICFPLRHSEFAAVKNTYVAIAALWFFGLVNPVVDSLYTSVTDPDFFTGKVLCGTDFMFITSPWQELLYQALNGFYYVVAILVIIYSYVCVMIVARSVSSDANSARKAHRTLLLHLIQLLLSLNTLLFGNIIDFLVQTLSYEVRFDVRYSIFLLVVLLPRCLSPLIYGLRDDTLRHLFLHRFKCGLCRAKMSVHVTSLY